MGDRKWLLTQNSELRPLGVYNWTIPALSAQLSDGRRINTCPNAGICASLCYARVNSYMFKNVKAAHIRNLEMVVNDLEGWKSAMINELSHKRYRDKWVRIHDAGDFFSDEYLIAWLDIAREFEDDVIFYAYTREVSRFKRIVEGSNLKPINFLYLYSLGGKEDYLVDLENDRHADVFPTIAAAEAAGYSHQLDDDRLCVGLPTNKIAVIVNNIPQLKKKQGTETFGSLQIIHDSKKNNIVS